MQIPGDTFSSLIKSFGLAGVGLVALWITLNSRLWDKLRTDKTQTNGNGRLTEGGMASGLLTVAQWEQKFTKMHEESNETLMADMRDLLENRLSNVVAEAIKEALEPLPRSIADALRQVLKEKGL